MERKGRIGQTINVHMLAIEPLPNMISSIIAFKRSAQKYKLNLIFLLVPSS
jgi:hypothetical protein